MSLRDNLNVLGGNKEKYKTFSVPTKKKIIKMEKDGDESVANISYKIKFIDSVQVHYQI